MPQPAPTPPPGQNLGDVIRDATQGIVANALAEARREIEDKIGDLKAQRAGLEDALRTTDSRPAQIQIQSRIDRVDREINELERALQKIGRNEVAPTAPARATPTFAGTQPPFIGRERFDPTPLVFGVLGILFIAFPLTLALVRFLWKRATNAPAPLITAEQQRRFDRLEQSVDAIAIEIERISENQRYLTKTLASSPREHSQLP